jgi:hypothetical protein
VDEVACEPLAGLRYRPRALPDLPEAHAALARFLDTVGGDVAAVAQAARPVVEASVRASPRHAAGLVTSAGEPCRWLRDLPAADRTDVLDHALAHRDLPANVRRVLERVRASDR